MRYVIVLEMEADPESAELAKAIESINKALPDIGRVSVAIEEGADRVMEVFGL